MTSRLIVPLDRSDVAECALPLANGLAQQLGAHITLLTVLDVPRSFASYISGGDQPPSDHQPATSAANTSPRSSYGNWTGWTSSEPTARQIEQVASETANAEKYLRGIAERLRDGAVETAVRFGHPVQRILDTSESSDGAMIVIASHGRAGLGRTLLGSVTSRVVQAARVPVFVVRTLESDGKSREEVAVRSVLVPVDVSAFSEQAIPVLENLFGTSTRIHLLTVVNDDRIITTEQASEYVSWLAERVGESGIPATWEVAEGSPSEEIARCADELNVDLIAMTTQGRSGLERIVMGSVAERVLHESSRPVMLVRPES